MKAVYTNPNRIVLERSLPFRVDLSWKPEIHDWVNDAYGMKKNFTGVADLTIR